MIFAAVDPTNLPYLVFGGAGLIGGIVALFKVRPEGDRILVNSAKELVIIQRDVIEDLQARLASLEEVRGQELTAVHRQLELVTEERDALAVENARLRMKIAELERRLDRLDNGNVS